MYTFKQKTQSKQRKSLFDAMVMASTLGLHMVSGLFVGILFGYALDQWLDSYPWCAGFGLFFGVIAGFRIVWIDAAKLIQDDQHD